MLIDNTSTVATPERISFRYRIAGPGQRAVAWAIDACLKLLVFLVIATAVSLVAIVPGLDGLSTGFMLLAWFFLDWFYSVFFEYVMRGRTPGKLALSLRVVRVDGSPARFSDLVLRGLLRGVDYLPLWTPPLMPVGIPTYGLSVLVMFIDDKQRRLGDLAAGTVVVAEDRNEMLAEVQIDPPVTEEERVALPPKVVLTRDERRAIEAFLRRRPRLSDERAEELAELFGPALSERTGVEAPTWERVLALAYARATGKERDGDAL